VLIQVNLGNLAPVASAGGPYTADLGSGIALNGSGSSDPNAGCGDSIVSYEWLIAGSISLSGATPSINAAQIAALGLGSYPVVLTVTDTFGATGSASTTLNIYNNQPVAGFTANPNPAACSQSISFDASSSHHDSPNHSIVSYSWDFGDGASATGMLVTHAYSSCGDYTATLTVTDDNDPAKTSISTAIINVINAAPILNAIGDKNIDELVELAFTATASDIDPVTFSLVGAPSGAAITAGGDFSWTPTEAQGPGSYIFTVKVCDTRVPALCDEETITVTVNEVTVTHTISLVAGWNLVSFNVHPTDTNIAAVLSSIAGNYNLVYAWDATVGSNNWKKYAPPPAPPYSNTLESLDETMGFWIYMTEADTLEVVGSVPTTTNIILSVNAGGWNLVAYPSVADRELPAALSDHGVGTDFSLVYAYHAYDVEDQWKLFDTTALPFANDLNPMTPGWGYWIKVSVSHTWHVEY
jgi:PKD repeat protein